MSCCPNSRWGIFNLLTISITTLILYIFFCVPAVGWNGANTASKALTLSQWALPSKMTWWYLCFFSSILNKGLFRALQALCQKWLSARQEFRTLNNAWYLEFKAKNFKLRNRPTRLTSPPDFPIFSGEHYCDLLSPYRFSDDQFKFLDALASLDFKLSVGHLPFSNYQ